MLDLVFAVFLPAWVRRSCSTSVHPPAVRILCPDSGKIYLYEIGKAPMVSDILIVLAGAWWRRLGTPRPVLAGLSLTAKSFVVMVPSESSAWVQKIHRTANPQPILTSSS